MVVPGLKFGDQNGCKAAGPDARGEDWSLHVPDTGSAVKYMMSEVHAS